MAVRAGTAGCERHRSLRVKQLYWIIGGVVIVVMLTVLLVPGVSQYIEGQMLGWLSRNAR